ncbi:hypothetical protein [Methylocella sp.]|uniref:hypothetical protein n=1 Tax=Methylocella sp. TaxID=1978226 RepID=UPI003784BC38
MNRPFSFRPTSRKDARRRLGALGLCVAAALALQGCGRRGAPEAPNASAPGAPPPGVSEAPLTTPSGVAPLDSASDHGPLRTPGGPQAAGAQKPRRPFPLDPVL